MVLIDVPSQRQASQLMTIFAACIAAFGKADRREVQRHHLKHKTQRRSRRSMIKPRQEDLNCAVVVSGICTFRLAPELTYTIFFAGEDTSIVMAVAGWGTRLSLR